MTKEQELSMKGLNRFKNMKLLYGDSLGMTVKGIKQLQKDIGEILKLLEEQEKEAEKYKNLYQKALDDAVTTAHDNMQKDKMVNLMSEQLAGLTIFEIDKEEPLILGDKEEVKQYFERKVENEGN